MSGTIDNNTELMDMLFKNMIGTEYTSSELTPGQEKMSILSKVLYRKVNYDGVTTIVTTHVKERLAKLASVFVQLESGKIIGVRSQNRRPKQKYKSPRYNKK